VYRLLQAPVGARFLRWNGYDYQRFYSGTFGKLEDLPERNAFLRNQKHALEPRKGSLANLLCRFEHGRPGKSDVQQALLPPSQRKDIFIEPIIVSREKGKE